MVGFDDNPAGRRLRPALTMAIERAKRGNGTGRARHVVLDTELVVRESTAAIRKRAQR